MMEKSQIRKLRKNREKNPDLTHLFKHKPGIESELLRSKTKSVFNRCFIDG